MAEPSSIVTGQVYRLVCDDGHYYIGSTISELKYRLYYHKSHSLTHPDRKVYKHIISCGWNTVNIECVEDISCNSRSELYQKENEYIKNALSDPLCLNTNKAHLTKEELLQQQKEYLEANKQKVDEYQAAYRQENAEERREYSRQYAADHPEQVKAAKKAYYEANKEECIAKQKAYVEANKEVVKQRKQEWAAKNKEMIIEQRKIYAQENKEAIVERGKAYYEANKEAIQGRLKAYREANLEKIKGQQKAYAEKRANLSESHTCDCGGKYTTHREKRHTESKRHLKYLGEKPS